MRVESELYPGSYGPPMSTTTMSPARSSRSEHSWCGSAPLRTRADDDERDLRMPFGDNGFGDVSGDVGLRPAGHQKLRHPACTRSIAAPALRSASISAASLIIRSRRSTSVANTGTTPKHVGQRQQVQRRHRIGDGGRGGPPPRASATSRYGSSPSTQSRTAKPSSVTAESLQRRQLHAAAPPPWARRRRAAPAPSAVRRSAPASRRDSAGRSRA